MSSTLMPGLDGSRSTRLIRMLGCRAAGGGQAMPDGGDGERCTVRHADGGSGKAVDALVMQVRAEQAAENVTNLIE